MSPAGGGPSTPASSSSSSIKYSSAATEPPASVAAARQQQHPQHSSWSIPPDTAANPSADPSSTPIDLLDTWYPQYLRCTQYFLEQGQFSPAVLSLAAFLNIRLPCQRGERQESSSFSSSDAGGPAAAAAAAAAHVQLRRYVRRLVVTAHDSPEVLQAFFGAEWAGGVGCVVQQERQTYLFTAKSSGWAATKAAYDLLPDEQTPFLRPLRAPAEEELRLAESRWSDWLAMEDWMVGPRSPWRDS
ncbi:uncharacterized protein BO72DRAFT_450972 [Aspergillus fijiensis CBS 313.89]|uniref:Uncharacterized protein n=1 Tax=Aspergillus fijiensis CBS 313.89 TaxID=1448319 RepID=A0A8G1RLP2_9EURO|nr:uncharacterized protein BO72DRAFT_450972 [Aspergillus fijiensis CBS 313.89]RAK74065.1 hypothetical protein BO72DRAFT_450972 [Aspergillus fijiensis CBS 313.89]